MSKPLSRQSLAKVYKELDEVAVAVSVVGTRRPKLMKLARMAYPVRDALVGMRPEVSKLRDNLTRAIHNTRRAQLKQRSASRAIWALAAEIKKTQKLIGDGLGDVPLGFRSGGMDIENVWGFTEQEVKPFLDQFDRMMRQVMTLGLDDQVAYGEVVFDPDSANRRALFFNPYNDKLVADPLKGTNRKADIGEALAARVWLASFGQKEHVDWMENFDHFARHFTRMLEGKKLDAGAAGVMAATTGVRAGAISEAIEPKEPKPKAKVKPTPIAIEKAIEGISDVRGQTVLGFYVKVGNMSHHSGPGVVVVRPVGERGDGVTFYSLGSRTAARRAARFIYNETAKQRDKGEVAIE